MQEAILKRYMHDTVTLGKLLFPWLVHPEIDTIELPWLGNRKDVSCIPAGIYYCNKDATDKYPLSWRVNNVPLRDGIRIHAGNFAKPAIIAGQNYESSTTGCICPGFGVDLDVPMVMQSKDAMRFIWDNINAPFNLRVEN